VDHAGGDDDLDALEVDGFGPKVVEQSNTAALSGARRPDAFWVGLFDTELWFRRVIGL
jgi:hypothetical protein